MVAGRPAHLHSPRLALGVPHPRNLSVLDTPELQALRMIQTWGCYKGFVGKVVSITDPTHREPAERWRDSASQIPFGPPHPILTYLGPVKQP